MQLNQITNNQYISIYPNFFISIVLSPYIYLIQYIYLYIYIYIYMYGDILGRSAKMMKNKWNSGHKLKAQTTVSVQNISF